VKLTPVQRLMLYALGHFYQSINQPLVEKPVKLQTSKITFIEHLKNSLIVSKQERALYKNLEMLENKKLIEYDNRMIRFTDFGLKELQKVDKEIRQCNDMEHYFRAAEKPHRKLQTVMER
jgi:hypothetical protein